MKNVQTFDIIEYLTGKRQLGWYTGRDSPNTRDLVAEQKGVVYDSDYYDKNLPFRTQVKSAEPGKIRPHLVIPYTLDNIIIYAFNLLIVLVTERSSSNI